jgi:hypothetical protein
LAYGTEVTFGAVPAVSFKILNHNSASPNLKFASFRSDRVDSSRNVLDYRHGMISTDASITVEMQHGAHDDLFLYGMGSTWVAGVGEDEIKIGTTLSTFSLEQGFLDLAKYRVFKGCAINEMEFEIKPDGLCMATFGIIGQDASAFQGTTFSTGALTTLTTGSVLDALTATITEGGSPIATVTGAKFKVTNGRSTVGVVGSRLTPAIFEGTADVTGSITALFETDTLYNKFANETESDLIIRLNDVDAVKWIEFRIPRIVYSTGNIEPPREGPVPITFDFQAIYDDTALTAFSIARYAP